MKRLIGFLFLIFFLVNCSNNRPIFVLSSSPELQLPLKASKFFGFFEKNSIDLQVEETTGGRSLIKFLNFSKYSVVITDRETAERIEKLSPRWNLLCTVALKKKANVPINKEEGEFVLLVKDTLFKRKRELITLIKGWNYGVDLLKDPAVVKLLVGRELSYRFHKCGK